MPGFSKRVPPLLYDIKNQKETQRDRNACMKLACNNPFHRTSYFKRHYAKDNLVKKFSSYLFVYIFYLGL